MKLKKLTRKDSNTLLLVWDDGHEGPVTLRTLRDACPCAACKGETVLFQKYTPTPPDAETPGRYALKGAEPIGNYAMRFTWGDGHQEGIYTWEHLRSLCECADCIEQRPRRAEG